MDTETGPKPYGLDYRKGRVLLVQIATPDNKVYMIRNPDENSKYLIELLNDQYITKVFHHLAFDVKFLKASLNVETQEAVCTKVLMKMAYPNTLSGLGHTLEKIFNVEINKKMDHSGWDKEELDLQQIEYAANDVLYLIDLYEELIKQVPHMYFHIVDAILVKSYTEVMGYTDLFDYSQNDYRQTKRERDWWKNKFK